MADPHEPSSKTSFDATMGDLFAAGLYGDPVRDNFASGPSASIRHDLTNSTFRHASPRRRLLIVVWFVAIFVISALVSPYIIN
jgi:hypothetical protein